MYSGWALGATENLWIESRQRQEISYFSPQSPDQLWYHPLTLLFHDYLEPFLERKTTYSSSPSGTGVNA
jgi:hypothetical protein